MSLTQVLAPVDLSEGGTTALQYARLFAEAYSARLTVVYGAFEGTVSDATRREVEVYAGKALANTKYDVIVESGQPVHVILRTARELNADLLVMGTHALRGWRARSSGRSPRGCCAAPRCRSSPSAARTACR